VTNTDNLSNYDVGLYGESQGPGISGNGGGIGVKGVNNSTTNYGGVGVLGIVEGATTSSTILAGVTGLANNGEGVHGEASGDSSVGVHGIATASGSHAESFGVEGQTANFYGSGVVGYNSANGIGVQGLTGTSELPTVNSAAAGVFGAATAGIGVLGYAARASAIPIVAQGSPGQTANLQEWQNSSYTALSAVIGSTAGPAPQGAIFAPQVGQTAPNYYYAAPTNPASFSNPVSAGYLADGLAIPFTPRLTGNVQISVAVDFFNPDPTQSTYGQIWYGTGSAPGFGAALPSGGVQINPGRGNPHGSGALFILLTGLTVGTAYWFDLGHGVENGGVSGASHNNIAYIIIEI
jgi:hypothetical protein